MSGGGALYPAHLHAAHSSSAIAPSSGPSQSHPSSNSARLASSTDPRRRAGSTQTGSVNGNPPATTAHRICSSTTVDEERWAEVTSAGEQDEYGAGPAWGRPAVRRLPSHWRTLTEASESRPFAGIADLPSTIGKWGIAYHHLSPAAGSQELVLPSRAHVWWTAPDCPTFCCWRWCGQGWPPEGKVIWVEMGGRTLIPISPPTPPSS